MRSLFTTADGERVEGTECDERIRAAKRGQKSFRSPRNSLVFKKVTVNISLSAVRVREVSRFEGNVEVVILILCSDAPSLLFAMQLFWEVKSGNLN